jgi:hypothetical protein
LSFNDNNSYIDIEDSDWNHSHPRQLQPRMSSDDTKAGSKFGPRQPRQYKNPFLSEDSKKRESRALRFHDSPIKFNREGNIDLPKISDEDLLKFYKRYQMNL